jgi:hypothetical protein
MIKFTRNSDYDFGMESVSIITDPYKSLIKRASRTCLDQLKYEKTPNQEDLHVCALGSYEGIGKNRNSDLFREKWCRKNHGTFVKAARALHRNHKNKPSDPKYGNIKASTYNEDMKRVELIVGVDKDKGQDLLHQLDTKGEFPVSMACKIPYDTCTFCGKKAKTEKDRCSHIPKQLGELREDGVECAMDNEDPNWFELSHVKRAADRLGVTFSKLAGVNTQEEEEVNYNNIYIPEEVLISKKAQDKRHVLDKLAKMEKYIDSIATPITSKEKFIKEDAPKAAKTKIDDVTMDELRKLEPAQALRVLSENGILFSPEDFAKYLFDKKVGKDKIDGMKSHLPNIFSSEDNGELVNNENFEPDNLFSTLPSKFKEMLGKLKENNSLFSGPGVRRIVSITITSGGSEMKKKEKTKEASDLELAKQYAAYKIAALNHIEEIGKLDEDLLIYSILQNRV